MHIAWPRIHEGIGNSFGYTTHQKKLLSALHKQGDIIDPEAPICLSLSPLYYFSLFRFKWNVLYSMVEYEPMPKCWHYILEKPDLILVPCTHNKRVFQEATSTPVEVVHEGVDVDIYPYADREKQDPFTFLYVGANNIRKGTAYIAKAWTLWNQTYPELAKHTQLIMKLTDPDHEQRVEQVTERSYVDYRVLPLTPNDGARTGLPTLANLYHFAHAFVLPSMGEGFGLTLAEAMATGLPCIYTPYSGPEDIASEDCAYPIEYDMRDLELKNSDGRLVESVRVANPRVESIVEQMRRIYVNYEEAIEKGQKASECIRTHFTWSASAHRFRTVLESYYPELV